MEGMGKSLRVIVSGVGREFGTAAGESLVSGLRESGVAECHEVEGHCAITSYRKQIPTEFDQRCPDELAPRFVRIKRYKSPYRVPYCPRTT